MTRLLPAWGPPILLMTAIFVMSSLSDPPFVGRDVPDVGVHAVVYGVLALLLARALANGRVSDMSAATAVLAVLLATLYGVTDEWHQRFVPGRVAELRDLVADGLGATVGSVCAWAWGIVLGVWRRLGA